jgi:hypothetical protein
MDFEKLLAQIKSELTIIFNDKWKDLNTEAKKDIDQFIDNSKSKLERWTKLLASGDLNLEDFKWLIESQKDLITLQAIQKTGVSKISLG